MSIALRAFPVVVLTMAALVLPHFVVNQAAAAAPPTRWAGPSGAGDKALNAWLDRHGAGFSTAELRTEAAALVADHPWAPWPERVPDGIVYVIRDTLNVSPELCQLSATTVATRLGTSLLDHGAARSVDVTLTCHDSVATAQWQPAAGAGKPIVATTITPSTRRPVSGPVDGAPVTRGASGVDFEIELLARTPFEENPRRTLDFAAATREPWFATHAGSAPLECWAALWGSSNRQCVARFPRLQPRQCAALALHAGYKDLLTRVSDGLSPRHTFELTAWCGENRARIRFTRKWRAEVEWYRGDDAASEMVTTILRKPPVALKAGGNARAEFHRDVDARDKEAANRGAEAIARMGRVARWFGAETVPNVAALVDAIGGQLKCKDTTGVGAVSPLACQVASPVAGVEPGPSCRVAAMAAAIMLPQAKSGPLAAKREFTLELACDARGGHVDVDRELDFIAISETRPDDNPSDLKLSDSDTVDVWSEVFENLRDVR